MTAIFIIIAAVVLLSVFACCKVSGDCAREEEQRDACETCLRWQECNGADRDGCPLCGAKTKTPRED